MEDDLRRLGFDVAVVDCSDELAARLAAAPAGDRVAVVDPRFTGHRHALRLALTDPRFPAGALPGALAVTAPVRRELAIAVKELTEQDLVPPGPDAYAQVLQKAGVAVHRPELGVLTAVLPADMAELTAAREAVAAVDDETVRLRSAVKSRDGFFTTYCISPYSRYLARWCARRGLTPESGHHRARCSSR